MKVLLYGMALSSVGAVVMTYSRGGAVALGVAFLLIVWYSRHKLLMLFSLALVSAPIVMLVGSSYIDRLSTIQTRVEERSAYSRIILAKIGVNMWMDYPMLGVGFGRTNQQALISRYLPSDVEEATWGGKVLHNTYIQLLVDSGAIAFLIYVTLLLGMIVALIRSARRIRTVCPHLLPYPRAIQVALVTFAVGATFLSRVEFDLYYFLLMAGQIWLKLEPSLVQEATEEPPPCVLSSESLGPRASASKL
jgi:O-antigen ligase